MTVGNQNRQVSIVRRDDVTWWKYVPNIGHEEGWFTLWIKVCTAKRVTLLLKKGYLSRLVKSSKTAIAICFNLLLFCPSMSSFVFTVLFILSLNGLSGYVCVSLNLVATFTVLILIVKAMLHMMIRNDSLLASHSVAALLRHCFE